MPLEVSKRNALCLKLIIEGYLGYTDEFSPRFRGSPRI